MAALLWGRNKVMKRFIIYIVGLNLIAAAVVLNIRYGLGVAAFSSVMYAIAEIYNISLGTATIICYLFFVLMQCLLSKKVTLTYALEIPLSFVFGLLTDVYDFLIPTFRFGFVADLILFSLTMFVTALGVFLCVKSRLILTPVDGIVQTISDVFSFQFSIVKNVYDISLVAASALLCLAYGAPFYGIGVGTILSAVMIGRIMKLYEKADVSSRFSAGAH